MKKSDSEHTDSGQEIADLVATLDELERKATPGPVHVSGIYIEGGTDEEVRHIAKCSWEGEAKFYSALRNAYPAIRAALKEPAGSQWIPCSERTPDEQYDVLVTDGKFVGVGDCCKGHLWNSPNIELVTHWQPLPPPPSTHSEGEK